jgi:hypothetical protein
MKYLNKQHSFDPFHFSSIFVWFQMLRFMPLILAIGFKKVILMVMLKRDSVHRSRSRKHINKQFGKPLAGQNMVMKNWHGMEMKVMMKFSTHQHKAL